MKAAIVVICLLTIPTLCVALIACLLFVVMRWSWTSMTGENDPGRRAAATAVMLCLLAAPFISYRVGAEAYRNLDHRLTMKRLPEGIRSATIEYRSEKAWGLGGLAPGDNETGLIVYDLNSNAATDVFAVVEGGRSWYPTPVGGHHEDERWRDHADETRRTPNHAIAIETYLDQYGFSIDIPAAIRNDINAIITAPGSFYRYEQGGGVLIVSPSHRKAYYAYAG